MEKFFENNLHKKKNGFCILLCMFIFITVLGTLAGCSDKKENVRQNTINTESTEDIHGKRENTPADGSSPDDASAADNNALENTIILTFSKEGETEQKQAVLMAGEGYSVCLPEGEWQLAETDTWTAVQNEKVRLWITCFEDRTISQVEKELSADGYTESENHAIWKQEAEMIYNARLNECLKDVWGVFYCYPAEAEEGWGSELPVIADTFAVLLDSEEIKKTANEFAAAYFSGDTAALQSYLADSYEGDIDVYKGLSDTTGAGILSGFTLKGLTDAGKEEIGSTKVVSLEFTDSNCGDMFLHLTMEFVRQEDGWKIEFYGLEG